MKPDHPGSGKGIEMERFVYGARLRFWIAAGLVAFYVLAGSLS